MREYHIKYKINTNTITYIKCKHNTNMQNKKKTKQHIHIEHMLTQNMKTEAYINTETYIQIQIHKQNTENT